MKIACPYCDFTKEVDPAKLPPGAKRATCPKCKQKFDLELPDSEVPAVVTSESGPPPTPRTPSRAAEAVPPVPPPIPRASGVPKAEPSVAVPPEPGPRVPPLPPDFSEQTAASPPPLTPRSTDSRDSDRMWAGSAPESAKQKSIPWEERSGTLISDLWATTKMVLFQPREFYDRMPIAGGQKAPMTYAMIIGSVGGIIGVFWQVIFTILGAGLDLGNSEMPLMWTVAGMVLFMIFMPVLTIVALYIMAAVQHLLLMIVRGADGGFEATFRVLAYSVAANIWYAIPVLGGFIGSVWYLVLMIMGLPRAHQTSVGRVIVAVLVIPMVLVGGLVAVAVFFAMQAAWH